MAEQWQYTRLLAMRQLNYQVVEDAVYIDGVRIGTVGYLASLDSTQMVKFAKSECEKEKAVQKLAENSAIQQRAYEDGQFAGEFMLALSPNAVNMPLRILYNGMTRLGEVFGYNDVRSNDAFKSGVMDKFDAYKTANRKLELTAPEDD